ncbi:MAG: hypothetical protein LBQ60_02870 [Bacteroidales bacterium]|jgi:hypothetical protein|nr:hypothetical protein [Bacteroidales bacterium]
MNLFRRCFHISLIIAFLFPISAFSGNDTIRLGRSFGLQISGFARVDYIYDTRQTAEAVEGLFTFYPSPEMLDANGDDINASPKANFLSIASRLSTRFFAPDVFGAKSSAYIEFDFTGTSNTNGVRLRQAYVNLAWKQSSLLLGRTWHPLAQSCIPNVIGLNTGAPFWAFNRSDQVRFNYRPNNWNFSVIALYQSDYASLGPSPSGALKSSSYMRDAVWPEFDVDIAYKTKSLHAGVVGSVKTIKPRLFTEGTNGRYKTDEKLTTFSAQAYLQYQLSKWIFKAQGTYAQNMTESLMIGGYAVSSINPDTGHETYTPTQYMNYWVNIDYGKKWQTGLFIGFLNSLGTLGNVTGEWYARRPDIKYMYRISPHLFYNVQNWQFAVEMEYTAAAFGDIRNADKAKIVNTKEYANLRSNLLVCFYF